MRIAKSAKGFIIFAITLSLLFTATAFSAVAEQEYDYDTLFGVVEYFEEPLIADEDFDGLSGDLSDSGFILGQTSGEQTVVIKEQAGNRYLNATLSSSALLASWNSAMGGTDDLVMSLSFMGHASLGGGGFCFNTFEYFVEESCPLCSDPSDPYMHEMNLGNLPVVDIYIVDTADGSTDAAPVEMGTLLFRFDYAAGNVIYYYGESFNAVKFDLDVDKWYNVDFTLTGGKYSFTVSDPADPTDSVSDLGLWLPGSMTEIGSVKIGSTVTTANQTLLGGTGFSLDNVKIQGGSFFKDYSAKQTVVEQAILDLVAIYTDSQDQYIRDTALSVFNAVVNTHGFTTDNAEVNGAIARLVGDAQTTFAGAFVTAVQALDASMNYPDRLAKLDLATDAFNAVPDNLDMLDAELAASYGNALTVYETELAALNAIKVEAEKYLGYANGADPTSNDYAVLADLAEKASSCNPDATYPGVADAKDILDAIILKAQDITTKATAFITAVDQLKAAEVHEDRLAAFLLAKSVYFDNATYPGVSDALVAYESGKITVSYSQLVVFAGSIQADAGYAVRKDHVDSFTLYREYLPADPSAIENANDRAAVIAYDDEVAALAVIDAKTRDFINAVNTVMNAMTEEDLEIYDKICDAYDELDGYEYDPTHPSALTQHLFYSDVVERKASFKALGDSFIKYVNDAADATDFATKYEYYDNARAIDFRNTSYPGMSAAIETFNALADYISPIEDQALGYINLVNSADYSLYLSAKEQFLNRAGEYLEGIQEDFPGVADAKVLESEIRVYILAKKEAAALYIQSVQAIEGKSGQALIDAINYAKQLQVEGNVPGVEGVANANIALSNAISVIEISNGYSDKFIELVNAIDGATTPEERFNAILAARAVISKADASKAEVAAAIAKLDQIVNGYNTAVTAVNNENAKVAENAICIATGVTLGIPETTAGRVIALIKKIYE